MRYELQCHPDTPTTGILSLSVWVWTIGGAPDERSIEFYARHDGTLLVPPSTEPARADGLWRTTCFEVFLMPVGGPKYIELNLSPSFQWAAYDFASYRIGVRNAELRFDPEITISPTPGHFTIDADLDVSGLGTGDVKMGLSAVIEETDGTKSYWALAHAPGPPDFHNPDCFIASLPAPDA